MIHCHNGIAKLLTISWISTFFILCSGSQFRDEYACFGSVFEIGCEKHEFLVFEEARYGRNDTAIAQRCQTPFHRNCDIDVHFLLNRVCAGKERCSLAVNTALFTDPCGYEEFLRVKYQCVAEQEIARDCAGPLLYDNGYIASPNYPSKYQLDARCEWSISVQQRQTIRVTMLDFELDVKKGGVCRDVLEISSGSRTFFKDCGGQGRQSIDIEANQATVLFRTGTSSITNRGFLLYFEAIGPGCPDLDSLRHGSVVYYVRGDVLYANASCEPGYFFLGTDADRLQLQCMGAAWNKAVVECIAYPPNTTPSGLMPPTLRHRPTTEEEKGSIIDNKFVISRTTGIALGVVSALLLLVLLLIITVYFQKRRRHRKAEKEHWRVVVNNLQENEINSYDEEQMWKNAHLEDTMPSQCNLKKEKRQKNKKLNNKEEELQGRNLLTDPCYDSEHDTYMMDYSDLHRDLQSTPLKSVTNEPIYKRSVHNEPIYNKSNEPIYNKTPQRRNSRGSKQKLFRKKSLEGQLDEQQRPVIPPPRRNKSFCNECGTNPRQGRPQSQRDLRHKRTKSGHWDPNKTLAYIQPPDVILPGNSRALTQSAPDLFELCQAEEASTAPVAWNLHPDQIYNYPTGQGAGTRIENNPQHMGPGNGTPIPVYATYHQNNTNNINSMPSHSYNVQPQSSQSSDNPKYRNDTTTPKTNRSRKSSQYVVPPTPPERSIQDIRC